MGLVFVYLGLRVGLADGVSAFFDFDLSARKRRIRIAFRNANFRVEEAVMGDARVALVGGGGFI